MLQAPGGLATYLTPLLDLATITSLAIVPFVIANLPQAEGISNTEKSDDNKTSGFYVDGMYFQKVEEYEKGFKLEIDGKKFQDMTEGEKAWNIYYILIHDNPKIYSYPLIITKYAGLRFENQNNPFSNSILIDSGVYHENTFLKKVLNNCDFKSNHEITLKTLSYRDKNGINLFGHMCRNRIALGKSLSEKIVKIYTENLIQDELLNNIDEFVFTLPPQQFHNILEKIGATKMQKLLESKEIDNDKIRKTIEYYHCPDIYVPNEKHQTKEDGQYKSTTVIQIAKTPKMVIDFIRSGYHVQVCSNMIEQIKELEGVNFLKEPNIYLDKAGTKSGILASEITLNKYLKEYKKSSDGLLKKKLKTSIDFLKKTFFTEKTAAQDLTQNLQKNLNALNKKLQKKVIPKKSPPLRLNHQSLKIALKQENYNLILKTFIKKIINLKSSKLVFTIFK